MRNVATGRGFGRYIAGVTEAMAMSGVPEDLPLERRIVDELPALRAYLRRIAGRSENVEDLVQEVAARALKYGKSFETDRDFGRWARGVALRVMLDQRSRSQRAPIALDHAPLDAGRELERHEDRETIQALLRDLSSVEREVIIRFHAREQSVREIADVLNLPEGTVKSHLHRARRKLAERRGP